jgi:ABC-type Mn2+/Zn2+ transport system permease subunit
MESLLIFDFFQYHFAQIALIAVLLVTIITGLLSPLVVMKGRSYLGDTLAHLVFPGVIMGLLCAQWMQWPLWICMFVGAFITALLGTSLAEWILKNLKIPADSAGVLCLTAFFAIGVILISHNRETRLNPDSILFGDVLSLSWLDVGVLGFVALIVLASVLWLRNHWDAWLADAEFAQLMGFRVKTLNTLFPILLTICVLSGIFSVGGLMISALITMPALIYAPRRVFSPPVLLGSVLCGLVGLVCSFLVNAPVGPCIVLIGFVCVLFKTCYIKWMR